MAMLCASISLLLFVVTVRSVDPDMGRSSLELINSKGYQGQEITVQTSDGYLLRVQRIRCAKTETTTCGNSRPAVLLQHGLLASSASWLVNKESQSLAYILADAGFDVWLGNMRGNKYGNTHVRLSNTSKEFWDFTLDDMAAKDLPAMVDTILKTTGLKQIIYVGHSQGTMIGFAQFSRDLDLTSKVKHFFALAPVAHVGNIGGPLRVVAPTFKDMWPKDGLWFMNGSSSNTSKSCATELGKYLCASFYSLMYGPEFGMLNVTRLPVYFNHMPAGTSVKNVAHFGQLVSSKQFRRFDYGSPLSNFKHYGKFTPPSYDLTKITVPISAYYSLNDYLADPIDVGVNLFPRLRSLKEVNTLVTYNHVDFILGTKAKDDIYPGIIKTMKSLA